MCFKVKICYNIILSQISYFIQAIRVYFCTMISVFGRLKKIDRLLIRSYVPPMLLSFLIALFVFTMQFFWLYIDEIIGKGVSFFQIIELISYMTISFVPLALPIAVLLGSVMVFGNMGEHYELSSMKSAGISLLRIMAPLVIVSFFVFGVSFLASNFIIPKANLKFHTRLADIRRKKPALALEAGVFNTDFFNYSIFIGKKLADNKSIEDVIIYDQSKRDDLIYCTRAKKGSMYTTDEGHRFVLELQDGEQVEEPLPSYKEGGRKNYPLMRYQFSSYKKSFDLDEFEVDVTDESRYTSDRKMLTTQQLLVQIDTFHKTIISGQKKVGLGVSKMFLPDTVGRANNTSPQIPEIAIDTGSNSSVSTKIDSFNNVRGVVSQLNTKTFNVSQDTMIVDLKPEMKVNHFYELLDRNRKSRLFKETGAGANIVQSEIINVIYSIQSFKKKEIQHWLQFHQKFTLAFACIMFLFIGAPMGAIVRKGGFGYPLLIAIIFFVVYIMVSKMFDKLADSFIMNVHLGAWMTSLLISLCGVYLTFKASKDMSSNVVDNILDKLLKIVSQRRKHKI